MSKIAIVSCYFQENYGSQLQAYATQMALDKLGVENETICISGISSEINKRKYKFFFKTMFEGDTIKEKSKTIKLFFKKKGNKELQKNITVRNKKFADFSNNKFRLSEKYSSFEQLTEACKSKYSSVIVGSDQLWLPSNIYADYYTLNFVPDNVNKISYATSFGKACLPDWQKETAGRFLKRFNHLSVREKSGIELIKSLTGLNAELVCDPTLLFDAEEWMCIQKKERIIKDKYIFCYFLGSNSSHRAFAQRLKEQTGYKIVALQHLDEYVKNDENYADIVPYDIGPGEFVNLIRNAEYICTDSFHSSVFSILNKKKFFTFMRFKNTNSMSTNSRITSLLGVMGLEDRMCDGSENVEECIHKEIDYNTVDLKVQNFRNKSFEFLKKTLESE